MLSKYEPVILVLLAVGAGLLMEHRHRIDLAQPDDFINFFSNIGLGMLFFFAGYEIEFDRIRGEPLKLAAIGWVLSLGIAYALGGLLEGYRLWHATRADLLRALGRTGEATEATERALALATNPAERELLSRRLAAGDAASAQRT